jgi:hypothetical protein
MTKSKSHAKWNGLSKQQQVKLTDWLFEEKMSYMRAWERAKKELGFKGSLSSLKRFYKRTSEERMLAGFAESARVMASVNSAPVSAEALWNAGMKLAAQVFFRKVTERPDELKEWLPLAKLLAQNEKNEGWQAVKEEENDIRRATLQFARVRHQYDTMGEALKALPELQDLREAQQDEEMTVYEKNKRLNDVRRQMFGDVIPELLPENEEEAANPEIIVRRFQEGQRRQQEQYARDYEERQKEQAEEKAKREGKKLTEANEGKKESREQVRGEGQEAAVEAPLAPEREGSKEGETRPEPENPFVDEPRKLSAAEREREYEELMRRARGQGR